MNSTCCIRLRASQSDRYRILFWVLAVSAIGLSPLHAQKPNPIRPFEIIPQQEESSTTTFSGRFDDRTGFPVVLYNLEDRTEGSNPEQRARFWLQRNASRLGLSDPRLTDLTHKHTRENAGGHNVRFSQTHLGLPVHGAEIVVSLDAHGSVRYLHNQYVSGLPAELPAATLSATQARAQVINWIGLQGPLQYDRTREVVWSHSGESRRMWEVKLVGAEPIGDWEALVDAYTGEFISLQDLSCYHHRPADGGIQPRPAADFPACDAFLPPAAAATGTGFVYDADPLSMVATAYAGAYVDGTDATNASLDAARSTKTLLDITLAGGIHSLDGPYAAIRDFEAPNKGLFTQASSTFNFTRAQDNFEAVNTYYFIDMSMRYLNLTLGVTVMPYQYANGVRFDPSGLNGADNSHFVGSTGQLAFGEGGVDDAEDSDVILHELGHGLHNFITVGGLSNVQGLSEGTGDYWTQSHSRSLGQWTTAQAAYHWVFNWDGHNPFWGGRITNYGAAYPGGLTGAIHTDGQIWSTCMMKVYDAIGRAPTDRALWEGLAMTGGSTNQQDAAIAVRQAAINMGYTSTQINTISTLLAGCGYVLPPILSVSLDKFTGLRTSPREVALDWSTFTEIAHQRFVVERRLETENEFAVVGEVAGSGDSHSLRQYNFNDPNSFAGNSYYRLRFVDQDGGSSNSDVVLVTGSGIVGLGARISPNPAEGALRLLMDNPGNNAVSITLSDLAGRTIVQETRSMDGSQSIELSGTEMLPAGVYQVQLVSSTQKQVLRWVKR